MGLLLTAANVLFALQAAQATVAGTVRDEETGEPLAGAIVALPDLNRTTATDAAGRYVLLEVPPGPQHITVRFIGYAQRALHALVPPGGRLAINVSLRAEAVRLHTIEVRSGVPLRGLDAADSTPFADRGASIAAVRNRPLLAEPDVLQALEGGPVVMQPESPSGVHVRGGASDHTAYLLDGIPVFSPYHAAGQFSAWNPDALSGVHLSSSMPAPGYPDALSGTIAAVTRAPGERFGAQGSLSTTQARVTLDGQIGRTGAGYLLSMRSRVPGLSAGGQEASYLNGEGGDWLAKLEVPVLGGRARVLGYESGNEIDAAAEPDPVTLQPRRHVFEWQSGSFGAEWSGDISGAGVRVLGWTARGNAISGWADPAGHVGLNATRRDYGVLGTVELRSDQARTVLGLRLERSRTSYEVESDSAVAPSWAVIARTPVAAAFAQHSRGIHPRVELTLGASVANAEARLHLGPRAQLRWRPADRLTLTGSYTRAHQFAQSLRNAESVVGNVFPVDLYVGAGAPGVPTARSDQAVISAEYHPFTGTRLGIEAYHRATSGLLLVAPGEGGPFATGYLEPGSGRSSGLSVEAGVSRARFGIVAGYGLQQVRFTHGARGYVPDHGTTHLLQGGVIVFPTATTSIRLGATSALGRRTTTATGGLEWESCNLLDHGCEFGGSPRYDGDPLGGTSLPAYLRIDLGVRKHWHLHLGGRDAMVALFGTLTNTLNRKNVLTYVRNPATGERVPIEMRPLAPLLVGVDWRF